MVFHGVYQHLEVSKQTNEAHIVNTGLTKVTVRFSADIFVINQNLFLRINICGINRHLRQARNRQTV